MGKRVKSAKPAIIAIKDWADADDILCQIGDCQLDISRAEADAKEGIDQVKLDLADRVVPQQNAIDQLTRSLEAFAVAHKAEFGKARSRKLNFGIIGWRQSTSIKTKKTTTVERIRQILSPMKAKLCIIVKETVSKDGLAKLRDSQLAKLGARREVKDDFFVEPDICEAANYE